MFLIKRTVRESINVGMQSSFFSTSVQLSRGQFNLNIISQYKTKTKTKKLNKTSLLKFYLTQNALSGDISLSLNITLHAFDSLFPLTVVCLMCLSCQE